VLLGAALPSSAQDESAAPSVLRVDTRLVQVDVVVLDDDGPVDGLAPEDFTLFADGIERDIQVFALTRAARPDAAPAPLPAGVVSNRIDWQGQTPESATVVLMDRFNSLGVDQPFMDHQARAFMDDAVRDNEHVAVYELNDEGLTLLGDYRSSPASIRLALDSRRPRHSLALESSLGALDDVQVDAQLARFGGDEEAETPFEEEVADYYLELRTLNTAAALESIARQLADLPGRKNLVWLASSFPFTFNPHQNPHLYRSVTFSTLERIEAVSRIMTDANIAIYPVDVRGLTDTEPTEISIMTTLADMTGGRASFNTNGLANAMRQAVRDAEVTYTLGFYVAEDESDTRFHELDVQVDLDEVDVRHRRGYYGFGGEPPLGPAPGLDEALVSAYDATSLGLLAQATPAGDDSGQFELAIIADVNDMALERRGDFWVGSLSSRLFFYATDAEESVVFPPETYSVVLTEPLLATARTTGFILRRSVDTEGRVGHLRVVIRDAGTGATGSLWVPLGID
jgi:VWFA-related protein